jgi:hypothetical protein
VITAKRSEEISHFFLGMCAGWFFAIWLSLFTI